MSDKVFKFFFKAKLSTMTLNLNFPCQISVVWKRGDKLAQTKERKPVKKGVVTFNQTIAIQCNMAINPTTKKFQSKKTILNVLIFTQKGTKQAGQVELDVSQPLNQRKEQKTYDLSLNKCPDKSAKLKFTLHTFFKQEIQMDKISQSSYNTVNVVEVAGKINQPDFKKKRQQQPTQPKLVHSLSIGKKLLKSEAQIKENVEDAKVKNLQQQNRKIRQDQKNLQKQQQRLIKHYQTTSMEANQWKRRSIQCQKQLSKLYKYDKQIDELDHAKKQLYDDILQCRQKIALIFNAAFEIGGPELADYLQQASGFVQANVESSSNFTK